MLKAWLDRLRLIRTPKESSQYDWQLLRIYGIYRVLLAISILVFFIVGTGNTSDSDARTYFAIATTYVGLCTLTALIARTRIGRARVQAFIAFVIDIVVMTGLQFAQYSKSTDLTLLQVVAVAAGSIILRGRMPKQSELRMFDALLVSAVDHGPGVASALCARVSASASNPVHASFAAGVLGFGDRHGMAIGGAMELFHVLGHDKDVSSAEVVASYKEAGERIPGYGHRVLSKDHRAISLFSIAKKTGVSGVHVDRAISIEKALNKESSKPLPLNIDGAMAAVLCDMGFSPPEGEAVFLIARSPGLLAHVIEEQNSGAGIRRLEDEEIVFTSDTL